MIVTEISEVTKNRVKIVLDGEFAFVLYKGELRTYGIKLEQPIQEENFHTILSEILPKRAKLRAMNLMKNKDYTEKQMRDKLGQGGYPEKVIQEAIDYVKSFHYIDDKRYATDYYIYQKDFRSKSRIEQDLLKKGISKELIKEIITEQEMDGNPVEEEKLIYELLRKKHYDSEDIDQKGRQKIIAFLLRKGFSWDKIKHAISNSDEMEEMYF